MEITSEATLRAWLTKALSGPQSHITNIESSTKNGIPDMNCCVSGHEFWVELKCDDRGRPLLRKEQRIWGWKHAMHANGYVYVLHWNTKRKLCFIYRHPILEVRVVSKYLEILDMPIAHCRQSEIVKTLLSLK